MFNCSFYLKLIKFKPVDTTILCSIYSNEFTIFLPSVLPVVSKYNQTLSKKELDPFALGNVKVSVYSIIMSSPHNRRLIVQFLTRSLFPLKKKIIKNNAYFDFVYLSKSEGVDFMSLYSTHMLYRKHFHFSFTHLRSTMLAGIYRKAYYIYAACAEASCFTRNPRLRKNRFIMYQKSLDLIQCAFDEPCMEALLSYLYLSSFSLNTGNMPKSRQELAIGSLLFMGLTLSNRKIQPTLYLACQMAKFLDLDKDPDNLIACKNMALFEKETRRRTWWFCWVRDRGIFHFVFMHELLIRLFSIFSS